MPLLNLVNQLIMRLLFWIIFSNEKD